ncbi:MAG: hypothetical protein IIW54_06110, partial [Lachnospiraceae bacterium]|nr:hypothetical protein [Lachnospiraceae bacterium]
MKKIQMKTSEQFHNSVVSSLDRIRSEGNTIMNKNIYVRVSAMAATMIFIIAVALFGADATGMVDLDGTFKSIFNIENDSKQQEIAQHISSNITPEATSNGVTVKVVQSVNDVNYGVILLELTSIENNLHPEMLPRGMNIKIDDARINYSSGIPSFIEPKSIEEEKALFTDDVSKNETAKPNIDEITAEFNNKYINKTYILVSLNSDKPILGKDINLYLDSLVVIPNEERSSEKEQILNLDISLNWKLSDTLKTRTVKLDKEVNGIKLDSVTLSPISYT